MFCRRRMGKNSGSSSRPIINIPGWNIPRTGMSYCHLEMWHVILIIS